MKMVEPALLIFQQLELQAEADKQRKLEMKVAKEAPFLGIKRWFNQSTFWIPTGDIWWDM